MYPTAITIRFEQVGDQAEGSVRRLVGFVKARNMLQLFDAADLEANPRSAKVGTVTQDIIESISKAPTTFPFKTKGVLIGASNYKALQRNRYELHFEDTKIEGVLDGGHNMLAIGMHILALAINEDAKYTAKKVKLWSDLKDAWVENRSAIEALRKAQHEEGNGGPLDFLVPVEVLVPSDVENDDTVAEFNSSLLDICAARNNNVELTLETKANKKGFYEYLRRSLPPSIADRVEWKSNDGGEVKVRDLVALTWIPLSVIDLPVDIKMPPQYVYANKGACAAAFDDLMSDPKVSRMTGTDYIHELHNTAVHSALTIAGQLPTLYDKIYREFPRAYNQNGGSFGKIRLVKLADKMKTKPTTHFTDEEVDYSYPDGLILPLVYGLKALMEKDASGHVQWKHDPVAFLDSYFDAVVSKYRVMLDAFNFDPQKIGKNEGSYRVVLDAFAYELMKLQTAA